MTTYELVSEELTFGDVTYLVEGCHRDWNPMPGTTPPEGTVWTLSTKFTDSKGDEQPITGGGKTKEEAMKNIVFMIGFKSGVEAIARHV